MNKFINRILIIGLISFISFSCKEDDTTINGIEIDKTELNMYDAGGEEEISVSAKGDWIAKSNASWCMVSPANGNGDAVCRVVVDQSTRYDERTAKITFICGSDLREITVNQLGYAPVIKIITDEVSLPYYADEEKAYFDVENFMIQLFVDNLRQVRLVVGPGNGIDEYQYFLFLLHCLQI